MTTTQDTETVKAPVSITAKLQAMRDVLDSAYDRESHAFAVGFCRRMVRQCQEAIEDGRADQ